MERFIKHCKEFNEDGYEWIIEDMEKNELFLVNDLNIQKDFEELFK